MHNKIIDDASRHTIGISAACQSFEASSLRNHSGQLQHSSAMSQLNNWTVLEKATEFLTANAKLRSTGSDT